MEIKVLIINPEECPKVQTIESGLKSLQEIVEGDIEAYYPFKDFVAIICNEEGKITGLPLNRAIYDEDGKLIDIIAGTFIIADCSGENFGSLNDEQIEKYKKLFEYPERFVRIDGKIQVIKYKQ